MLNVLTIVLIVALTLNLMQAIVATFKQDRELERTCLLWCILVLLALLVTK